MRDIWRVGCWDGRSLSCLRPLRPHSQSGARLLWRDLILIIFEDMLSCDQNISCFLLIWPKRMFVIQTPRNKSRLSGCEKAPQLGKQTVYNHQMLPTYNNRCGQFRSSWAHLVILKANITNLNNRPVLYSPDTPSLLFKFLMLLQHSSLYRISWMILLKEAEEDITVQHFLWIFFVQLFQTGPCIF